MVSRRSQHSPPTKGLAAAGPTAGEGLFLGMCTLMPLYVLHPPGSSIGLAKRKDAREGVHGNGACLKRLLQYLQGRVLGFC